MTIETMPDYTSFRRFRMGINFNTKTFTSPYDRTTQTAELPGARWEAAYEIVPKTRANADEWLAFLARMRGPANRFYGPDPSRLTPRGTVPGTPLVNGGSQSGSVLMTDSWTASQSGIFLAGDLVAYNVGIDGVLPDLFDPGAGGYETDIGAWTGGGGNGVEVSTDIAHSGSKSLKITYVDTINGPYLFFRNSYDLFADLTIDKKYRVIFWTAVNSGSVTWQKNDGAGWTNEDTITSTSLVKVEFDFIATSTTGCGLRPNGLGAGEIIYIDDISIQEVVGSRSMHMVTADVDSDSGGNAAISVSPIIRTSPDDDATIITTNPTCTMQPLSNSVPFYEVGADGIHYISFAAVESF